MRLDMHVQVPDMALVSFPNILACHISAPPPLVNKIHFHCWKILQLIIYISAKNRKMFFWPAAQWAKIEKMVCSTKSRLCNVPKVANISHCGPAGRYAFVFLHFNAGKKMPIDRKCFDSFSFVLSAYPCGVISILACWCRICALYLEA